jgi:pimeloyl-ACP methyl ester carboxylesterase
MKTRFWLLGAMSLMWAGGSSAQTAWPDYMPTLEPAMSESTVAAVLPADVVITPPAAGVPQDKSRWSGVWHGWGCRARLCDVKLAVENVTETGARVVYVGAVGGQPTFTERVEAQFEGGELVLALRIGSKLVFRMRASGDIELSLWKGSRLVSTGVLTQKSFTYTRTIERVPTPWVKDGKPETLEMVVFKPQGAGPFPTLVFNHGSTGDGNRPEWFTLTWTAPEVAGYFMAKGWQVVFPQRRGRGKSDGLYDEGFMADRSRYACEASLSLPGLERALSDVDAVMAHLQTREDVDPQRMLIGGVSRGGILSVVYAGTRPGRFAGVLNFVGGWVGDRCSHADDINPGSFKRGGPFGKPMLWLYGESDPFYSLRHSRKGFEAFLSVGGQGSFATFEPVPGQSGHGIHASPALWRAVMDRYLEQLTP